MGSFNWQDEEGSWDATQDLADNEPQAVSKLNLFLNGRVGRFAGLIVVGLIGIGLALWWWVDSVEADLSDEVLESWRIVISSESAGDIELFTNQLSGTNEGWIETQKELLGKSALSARGPLLPSLTISPTGPVDFGEAEIVFSPDLTEATLTHSVAYYDRWGREVTLLQDEIFRLGADRWLFSPPRSSYWGAGNEEELIRYSNRFAYVAPEKDAEVTEQIILWFEDRLDAMCENRFLYACHTNRIPQVEIRFSPSFTDRMLDDQFYIVNSQANGNFQLIFPTPSLIGNPATERDHQLFAEAYGDLFFADYLMGLIATVSGYGNIEDVCLRAVAEHVAQQADAIAPLTVADYARYIEFVEAFNSDEVQMTFNDVAQLEFSALFLKLMIQYRLQKATLTPQMLLDLNLATDSATFCSSLNFKTEVEREDFYRFVEVRSLIQN